MLATMFAAIGLYGGLANSVARRTHGIGVRMALGAERRSIVRMVMRDGLRIVATGAIIGVVPALAAARAVFGVLYGISPWDPLAWGSAVPVMIAAGSIANLVPARRAAAVDPMRALRAL